MGTVDNVGEADMFGVIDTRSARVLRYRFPTEEVQTLPGPVAGDPVDEGGPDGGTPISASER